MREAPQGPWRSHGDGRRPSRRGAPPCGAVLCGLQGALKGGSIHLQQGWDPGKGGDGIVHPGGGGGGTGAAVVAGLHAVLQTAGDIRGEGVADDKRFPGEDGGGAGFIELPEGGIKEGGGGFGGADALRNEKVGEILLHPAQLQPVQLLFIGAVAGGAKDAVPGEALQQRDGTGDGNGAFVDGGAEVMLEGGAVKGDAESVKNAAPADFLELLEGKGCPPRSGATAYYFRW